MKKKILICAVLILVIAVLVVVVNLTNKPEAPIIEGSGFVIDNSNKYIVTTSAASYTMMSDGGSHTNIYYEIDLTQNTVVKRQDKYVGFKGYEYKGKMLDTKTITDIEKVTLKTILDDAVNKGSESRPGREVSLVPDYYIISSFNNEDVTIYNVDTINEITNILVNK